MRASVYVYKLLVSRIVTMSLDHALVIGAQDVISSANIMLDSTWTTLQVVPEGGDTKVAVYLKTAFKYASSVLYIFGRDDVDAQCAVTPPSAVKEIMLFAPVVPLRRTCEGFQALTESEWKDVMMPMREQVSSAQPIVANTEECLSVAVWDGEEDSLSDLSRESASQDDLLDEATDEESYGEATPSSEGEADLIGADA